MKISRIIIAIFFLTSIIKATETKYFKACELIEMSPYTKLFSCHKADYLVEYEVETDLRERDNIKKITLITDKKEVILKNTGK